MSENRAFDFKPGAESKPMAVYRYENEAGDLVFEKERYVPKAFRLRRWVNGRVIYNLRGVDPIPYRLPKWKDASSVLICEGEKDADAVAELGLHSTTGPFGAASWPVELTPWFKNKTAYLLYDVGEEKVAEFTAASLYGTAKEVRIIHLPPVRHEYDISDHLVSFSTRSGKITAIHNLQREATLYQPPEGFEIKPEPVADYEKEERLAIQEESKQAQQETGLQIQNDFLNLWVDSISRVTDAPKVFILFSGIGLLSGILNKFWFSYPRRTPLNLYLLLLAPSTLSRKSVCIDIAGDYLAAVNPGLILPESFSPEALIEILSKKTRGLILWRELIQVKEFNFGSDYSKALPSLLTDIYDFKARLKRWTKAESEIVAENPTLTILSAGIQSWLVSGIRQEDFMGGIWTRFLFIPAPEQDYKPYRRPNRFSLLPEIIERLRKLDTIEGCELDLEMIFPLLDEWGGQHQAQAMKIENDLMQANFLRFEVALLKIAAILQLADNPSSFAIEPKAFLESVKILNFLKYELPIFFEEHVVFGEEEKNRAAVIRLLKKHGQLLHSDLQRLAHIRKSESLYSIMTELKGLTKEDPVPPTSQGGKPGKLYSWIGRK